MKKLMLMSALAGAVLMTTVTTSCKKGDQGPAGANGVGKDGKNTSPLETGLLTADIEYTNALKLNIEGAVTDVKEDVVANWVTKEDKDKSTQNLSLYLNQVEYNKLKADADRYVSDADYEAAKDKLKKSVTPEQIKKLEDKALNLNNVDKDRAFIVLVLEGIKGLEVISTTEQARLKSLAKTTSNPAASKTAKDKAKNAILDVDGKLKIAAQVADAKLVVSQAAGADVTDAVKTATLNLLKQKAAKAKLEAAKKALADSKAPVASAPKAPVSVK